MLGCTVDSNDALRAELRERVHPNTLTAGFFNRAKEGFDEALHPRGRDGRFIEIDGFVRGSFADSPDGARNTVLPRAKVVGFEEINGETWVKVTDPALKDGFGYNRAAAVTAVAGPHAFIDHRPENSPNAVQRMQMLRMRVHGGSMAAGAVVAAAPSKPKSIPKKKAPAKQPSSLPREHAKTWDTSAPGAGWNESKVKRDTDPGEEGQFDFKDDSKKKGGGGGGGGKGRKGKDPAKEAERAAKKAAAETEKRAREARQAVEKRAAERKAAEARARRTKPRKPEDIKNDINDLTTEMRAEEAARGLKPGQDYPGKMEKQKKVALLRVELMDAELGDDAPISERIRIREEHLAQMKQNNPGDEQVPPEILQALEDDLQAFKDKEGEVFGTQAERKRKKDEAAARKAEAERKRAEAEKKRLASEAKRKQSSDQQRAMSDAERKQALAMRGIQSSGKDWSADARKTAAEKGHALPDGSYPIVSKADWYKARQALGRAKNRAPVVRHLKKRAKALGIPESELDGITE